MNTEEIIRKKYPASDNFTLEYDAKYKELRKGDFFTTTYNGSVSNQGHWPWYIMIDNNGLCVSTAHPGEPEVFQPLGELGKLIILRYHSFMSIEEQKK